MHPKWLASKTLNLENKKYLDFIRTFPCVVCGNPNVVAHHNYHGTKWKNDYLAMPLCQEHHGPGSGHGYHDLEHEGFESVYNLNIDWLIIEFMCRWNAREE